MSKQFFLQVLPNNRLLHISMYLSSTVGIWPFIFEENRHLKRLYNIFSAFFYYYYLQFICRAYYQLTVLLRAEKPDVEEILSNLCVTLVYTVSMLRLNAFKTDKIRTLFSNIISTEDQIFQGADVEVRKIYLKGVKLNRIYKILFIVNGYVVLFMYLLRPFNMDLSTLTVNNQTITLRTLPLSTWWPMDIQKYYWVFEKTTNKNSRFTLIHMF